MEKLSERACAILKSYCKIRIQQLNNEFKKKTILTGVLQKDEI